MRQRERSRQHVNPAEDLQQLERRAAQREADFTIFKEISEAFQDESLERIERAVDTAVREVRDQRDVHQRGAR